MALRSLRECRAAGCHELTREESGFCKIHQSNLQKMKMERKDEQFYRSRKWQNKRVSILKRDSYVCIRCLLEDSNPTPAETVHHIIEVLQNYNKRLDSDNLISLCWDCHREIHREYDKGEKQKKEMQQHLKKLLKDSRGLL